MSPDGDAFAQITRQSGKRSRTARNVRTGLIAQARFSLASAAAPEAEPGPVPGGT